MCCSDCDLGILTKALHNMPKLVKLLNVSHNLLRQLVASSCMTSEQMNSVVSKPTPEDQNRALFDVLEQQGFKSFEQIVKCFKDSGENDALLWVLEHEGGNSLLDFSHILYPQKPRIFIIILVKTDEI